MAGAIVRPHALLKLLSMERRLFRRGKNALGNGGCCCCFLATGLLTVSERSKVLSFFIQVLLLLRAAAGMYSVTSSCWWEFLFCKSCCTLESTVLSWLLFGFFPCFPRDSHVWSHLFWLLWSIINSVPGSRGGLRSQDAFLHGISVDDHDNILDTLMQSICADFLFVQILGTLMQSICAYCVCAISLILDTRYFLLLLCCRQ